MKENYKNIHKILDKTILTPQVFVDSLNGDGFELTKLFKKLQKSIDLNYPKKLYKYRQYNDNSVEALINDEIYLSRADYFNDPYDCLIYFDKDDILKNVRRSISHKKVISYIKSRYPDLPSDKIADFMDGFIKNKDDFLQKVEHCLSDVPQLHQKNMFVSCFSETITSPLMWSHYSDNHNGFAIEYQFGKNYFCPVPYLVNDDNNWHGFRSLLPVDYSESKKDATHLANWYAISLINEENGLYENMDWSLTIGDLLLPTKLALCKSKDWSYEKEWRLIISREWPMTITDKYCSVKQKPSAIYIGERIDEQNKVNLIRIAKSKDIPVYEMYSDYSYKAFDMKIRDL